MGRFKDAGTIDSSVNRDGLPVGLEIPIVGRLSGVGLLDTVAYLGFAQGAGEMTLSSIPLRVSGGIVDTLVVGITTKAAGIN
ncbi:MAG: hypothetical protein OXC80_02350 [Gammaproteobacteria bacterium]|nr:hypothetical protein [Gammaproteobacteria bacterium]